jgi:hypothetical protein
MMLARSSSLSLCIFIPDLHVRIQNAQAQNSPLKHAKL